MPDTLGFRIRFYQAATTDLLRFLHGHYGEPIAFRPRDGARIDRLRSGPALFLTAHFHHWEHMGAWMTRQGIPLLSAARPMANPFSQSLLVMLRKKMRMEVAFHDIPRRALRHVNQGRCFGLLWDQRVPKSGAGPRAELFGRPLTLDPLPHFLTRHVCLPVYFGVLLPGGRFRIFQIAGPRQPLPLSDPASPPPATNFSSSNLALNSPALSANLPTPSTAALAITSTPSIPSTPFMNKNPSGPSDPYRNLGRRYHRILEILVRAYPAYWYGLAHSRFQGSDEPE